MKKKPKYAHFSLQNGFKKLLLVMRLSIVFSLFCTVAFSAGSFSQNRTISLKLENARVKDIFRTIENKTSYRFFYNDELCDINKKVDLYVSNMKVEDVLKKMFRNSDMDYTLLENNMIVVAPKRSIQQNMISGTIIDLVSGLPLPGVNIVVEGTTIGTVSDADGKYSLNIPNPKDAVLVFSMVSYKKERISVDGRSVIDVKLATDVKSLEEVVVVGYGSQKKESVTAAISGVTSEDLDRVHASTVTGALAGKLAGVSFRQQDGRPGSGANVQIRNMGTPLYVIDGFQKDAGTFNNLSENDIESITILKDASASIYGSRGANGVVVVTTKRGKTGERNQINVNAYTGWQNWTRFPRTTNAYEWMTGKADAEMNSLAHTTQITPEELAKWKAGTEKGYQSFDWYKFIIKPNSPMNSINVNAQGGSDKINYFISGTRVFQNSVLGRQFTFARTNIATSIEAKISKNLKVGAQITGRDEKTDNPGVPGGDDYWAPRFALLRNRPTERPYANDNPDYINDIGHNEQNWALFTKKISGYWTQNWRVFQANFNGEYTTPIKGLKLLGKYSYYLADKLMNGHEYTYQTYTYDDVTKTYNKAFAMMNPWRERGTEKVFENVYQGQLNYDNTFGKNSISAFFVAERIERKDLNTWVHSVPSTNILPLLYFNTMDTYNDGQYEEARVGYVGHLAYNYARRYYVELSAREDASWKFSPDKRWGFFPSVSAGWRITEEDFFKSSPLAKVFNDFKIRGSYGVLGDDDIGIGAFDYLPGYNYNTSTFISDGNVISGARYRGEPVTNVTWFTSKITDLGIDYSLFNGKISGAVDYFYRKRTGLLGNKWDVVTPAELGYSLPQENVNSDAVLGGDGNIEYHGKKGDLNFVVGANFGFARHRNLNSYKPRFNSQYNQYFNSGENRWAGTYWGYNCIGQFQSQEEINNYTIDNDGQGNKTMLPGDLKYEDINKDGVINDDDVRPIGYARDQNPTVNYGFNFSLQWKGFDLLADFSGGTMYSYDCNWEMRWPFQNTGALLKRFYDDRWHRQNIFDVNSAWVPGKYPALRWNEGGHSNYNKNSTFWLINVRYLRARTLELGYTVPKNLTQKVGIEKARIYVNAYNLFSLDNLKDIGVEPEIMDENGLEYPQNKFVNLGINLTF